MSVHKRYKPSLESRDVLHKIWARSVQPFWHLLLSLLSLILCGEPCYMKTWLMNKPRPVKETLNEIFISLLVREPKLMILSCLPPPVQFWVTDSNLSLIFDFESVVHIWTDNCRVQRRSSNSLNLVTGHRIYYIYSQAGWPINMGIEI